MEDILKKGLMGTRTLPLISLKELPSRPDLVGYGDSGSCPDSCIDSEPITYDCQVGTPRTTETRTSRKGFRGFEPVL